MAEKGTCCGKCYFWWYRIPCSYLIKNWNMMGPGQNTQMNGYLSYVCWCGVCIHCCNALAHQITSGLTTGMFIYKFVNDWQCCRIVSNRLINWTDFLIKCFHAYCGTQRAKALVYCASRMGGESSTFPSHLNSVQKSCLGRLARSTWIDMTSRIPKSLRCRFLNFRFRFQPLNFLVKNTILLEAQ